MKIALFQDVSSEFGPRIHEESHDMEGYIRVSGYVEVEFPPLEPEAVEQQLAVIAETAALQRELYDDMFRRIEQRRAALTAQSTDS